MFSDTNPDALLQVASVSDSITLPGNENIFREGDTSVYLYLVVSGKVKISRQDREIFIAHPNESFGLVGLVEEKLRATSATATEETNLLRINYADLFDLMEDYPSITRGVLRGVSVILRKLL
ncbi:MAG: cyclic nucleotide-binding domain-containing protein [Candidatus Marinimicrobia bacterium]|nr:cyclic nucleotide-binding domain-containing protein [Candidatus Neomarinimicrobiota bacterium]